MAGQDVEPAAIRLATGEVPGVQMPSSPSRVPSISNGAIASAIASSTRSAAAPGRHTVMLIPAMGT